jgi:anti-anti-sigma factor
VASGGPLLRVSVVLDGDSAIIGLDGELDVASQSVLADALRDVERHGPRRLVVDAERLTFLDAAGLHPLLAVQERMPAATVQLRNVQPQIRRMLRILDLASAFGVDD